jgi:hypothetical protein
MMGMFLPRYRWLWLLVAFGALSCRSEPAELPAPAAPAVASQPARASGLADVLAHAVTAGGWVVVDNLEEHAASLDGYLAYLAAHGPTATPAEFPNRADRLAYWLNARAACSLKLGLLAGCGPRMTPTQLARAWPVDGRPLRLADIDAGLAAEGGWLALAGSPGVTMDRAPLPARPFSPTDVEAALQERLETFLSDNARVVIDVEARQLRLPPIVWGRRDQLIERYAKAYRAASPTFWSALQDVVNGPARRRLQDAVGYQLMQAPADGETCFRKWHELLD